MSDIRRSGNTTWAIDTAVQKIFNVRWVNIIDPFERGTHRNANKDMFERFLRRMRLEHNIRVGKPVFESGPYLKTKLITDDFGSVQVKLINSK